MQDTWPLSILQHPAQAQPRRPGEFPLRRGGVSAQVGIVPQHPHFHSAVTDGVFAETPSGQTVFYEASDLTRDDIESLKAKLHRRVLAYLERHGCLDTDVVDDMLSWDHNGGFSLDGTVLIEGCPQNEEPCGSSEDGFARDRQALERLLRYRARPPFASERLGIERYLFDSF